jgi:glutaredoxin
MTNLVTVFSRHGCHLCQDAVKTLEDLKTGLDFEIEIKFIDGSPEYEKLYGEYVPVIHIDGEHHDFYKVDPLRLKTSLEKRRLHQ